VHLLAPAGATRSPVDHTYPGQEALGLPRAAQPGGVEVARAADALVVVSAEPLAWERIELAVTQSAAIPLPRREVAVERAAFGVDLRLSHLTTTKAPPDP
jgi:hypothetical protein